MIIYKNRYETLEDLFDEVTCESSKCENAVQWQYDDSFYCRECAEDKFPQVAEREEGDYKEYCEDKRNEADREDRMLKMGKYSEELP